MYFKTTFMSLHGQPHATFPLCFLLCAHANYLLLQIHQGYFLCLDSSNKLLFLFTLLSVAIFCFPPVHTQSLHFPLHLLSLQFSS